MIALTMTSELAFVDTAAGILRWRGKVQIGYVTANLEPYSASQKPDLSFVPGRGPNAERVYFVELRLFGSRTIPPHYAVALREHRTFAAEEASSEFAGFAFATDQRIEPDMRRQLGDLGIHLLESVTSGEDLAERIIAWTSVGGGNSPGSGGRIAAS